MLSFAKGTWIKYCGEVMQVVGDNSVFWYCDDHTMHQPRYEEDLRYIDKDLIYDYPETFKVPTKEEIKYKVKMWRLLYG